MCDTKKSSTNLIVLVGIYKLLRTSHTYFRKLKLSCWIPIFWRISCLEIWFMWRLYARNVWFKAPISMYEAKLTIIAFLSNFLVLLYFFTQLFPRHVVYNVQWHLIMYALLVYAVVPYFCCSSLLCLLLSSFMDWFSLWCDNFYIKNWLEVLSCMLYLLYDWYLQFWSIWHPRTTKDFLF